MKRGFDLILSFLGLIFFSPLFLIISLVIFIEDRRNPFFLQKRGGRFNHPFNIIKFRTMKVNAEKMGAGYKISENDTRITIVGKFLRKTSLDEIPQLINVFKGDMSIVGPRPALTIQTNNYNEYQKQRLNVRPGITGLAQVNGRNSLTWEQKIELDLKYIDNMNFCLDMKIIFMTILKIFKSENIYQAG